MRKPLVPLALLALAGLLLGPSTAHAQKPRAERPTYAVGDKWIRSDGVYDLVRIEKDMYIFAAEGGREIRMTKDLAIAAILTAGAVDFEFDPPLRLTWPLEVGKWGMTSGLWKEPSHPHRGPAVSPASGTQAIATWSVEAYEDIHVPAGTFRAFRVLFDTSSGNLGGSYGASRNLVTAWYAPEVRQFVKFQGRANLRALNIEVVAIERPGPAGIQVALEGLPDQARVSTESLVVVGKVSASTGIARVTVTLNGQDISKQEEKKAAKKELALSVPLQLKEGKNLLLITAVDAGGETRQEARTVIFEKAGAPPPAPSPPVAALPPPFVVSLVAPTDQARVEQETIGLSAVVSGGKGVSRVVVMLNGLEVSRLAETSPQRALPVNLPLKLREGQNTVVVTAAEPDGTIHQEVRTVHYEKPVPLTMTVQYPVNGIQVSQESSVVAGVITSSKGVSKVSVTLNGAEVHQQTERTPQKSVAVTVPLTLREGANAIVVSAIEAGGTIRQDVRTIIYNRPQQVAAAPSPMAPPPLPIQDRWAVVIGVGRYESEDVPRLRYTVSDAEAIYQVLVGPGGFKKEHVLLLTDKTERKPTLRNIRWALGTFLSRSARKDDTVLIYFAGHGAPEVDPRGMERDGLAKYLIPGDADPEDLYSSALPMDELQTIFGRIEAERVVAFLDTCYSGAAGGRTFISKRTRSANLDDLFLERLTRSKGRAIITASRTSEVSIELPELGHGIFTYYLIEGLKGAADLNKDGIVTVQELYEYVEAQVSKKSRAVGGNQHPVMKGEMEGALPLVKVSK